MLVVAKLTVIHVILLDPNQCSVVVSFIFCLFQSFAWSSCSEWSVGLRVPFVVDVCPMTFEQLDLLLRQVSEGMDGSSDWPPPQEKECMVVATLNLLRLQVIYSFVFF